MPKNSTLARLVAALLAPVALLACNGGGVNSPPPPAADRIDALVLGPVSSAYLEPLRPAMNMVQHTGSQRLEDFDMVILDGDHHTPDAVKAHPLVDEALRTGTWVLGVDLAEAHKKGLEPILHASTCGTSAAYAARTGYDANGRFQAWVIEPADAVPTATRGGARRDEPGYGVDTGPAPTPGPAGRSCDAGASVAAGRPKADLGAASAFAQTLLGEVAAPARVAPQQGGPPTIPSNLIYATYYFKETWSTTLTNSLRHAGRQTPNYTVNRTYTVFNNNKNNPQGDFQYVLLEQDASANPLSVGEGFIGMGTRDGTDWDVSTYDETAWFQSAMRLYMTADSKDWSIVSTSPDTVNGSTTVSTGTSFSIGFNQAQGATGNFTYSNSETRNIADWAVFNQSTNADAQWWYRSNDPYNSDNTPGPWGQDGQKVWTIWHYLYYLPNALSLNTLKLYTQTVWQTPTIVDGPASFSYYTGYQLVDLACTANDGFLCGSPSWLVNWYSPHYTQNLSLDPGVVVPVPIASITFSPSPAKGGTAVTGTVTLTKPAKIDTLISLTSNSQNATVLPSVTVKQGQTSATFQVLTNANNIAPGGSTVATVQAFYAQNYQVQLTVTN